MDTYEKFIALKKENLHASSKRKNEIDAELERMSKENPKAFAAAFEQSLQDDMKRADELLIKKKLQPIVEAVSLSYIAKKYFGKTRQWLYQRLNANAVNGKPAQFTQEEIDTLNNAIHDLSLTLGSIRL